MPARSWPLGIVETTSKMLEMAAHSYAVANAEEAVKAVAKHLAPSHQEGGVYQVIEEYLGLTPWEQVKGKN